MRASDLPPLTGWAGGALPGTVRAGAWLVSETTASELRDAATEALAEHHRDHPLRPGLAAAAVRRALAARRPDLAAALEHGLGAEILGLLERTDVLAREGTLVRLASHTISLGPRGEEAERLVARVRGAEPTPPTLR